ncbi:olfactory receptor 11H6-like isoform X1 [Crotalus tigris]|uniref:olfactory receptor 11H6-like isoform X1 n=2 Tax=Crotalus tigris TaxID=88082 RepID=UPI00192F91C6|nr:olfactory receptor 11H6-like isoform X1 [Crotalus tigris]XP_039206021.1 olfactory receptor 11H6-like isoform X1 [Crotalus tigris]
MATANSTKVQEFILVGFGDGEKKRLLLLIFFTTLYILTLAENIIVITIVVLDTILAHLPMYILLSNFSWLEMCYVSTTVPRMILDLISPNGTISFHACFLQYYSFVSLGSTECFFLSTMALDRYLAICHPLRYPYIMSPHSCYALVAICWILGFLWNLIPVVMISKLDFCGPNIIDNLICDPGPILSLACSPLGNMLLHYQFAMSSLVIILNLFFAVLSYSAVVLTLVKATHQSGSKKAFSTISFHLMVVTLFYGSVAGMYIYPSAENESGIKNLVTVFYTAIIPFLNPMIYCWRNDQMKEALDRVHRSKVALLRFNPNKC